MSSLVSGLIGAGVLALVLIAGFLVWVFTKPNNLNPSLPISITGIRRLARRVRPTPTPSAVIATQPAGDSTPAQTPNLPWYRSAWNKIKENWILAVFGAIALGFMVFGPREHKTNPSVTSPTSAIEVSKASEPKKSFLAGLPIVGHYFQGPQAEKVARLIVLAVQQTESGRGLDNYSFPYGDDKPRNILGLGCEDDDGLDFDQAFSNLQREAFGNSQQKGKFTFLTDWQFQMGVKRTVDQLKRDRTPRDILRTWDTEVKGCAKSHRAYDDALVAAFVSVSGGEYQLDTPCSRLVNASIWDYQIWKPARLLGLLLLLAPWLFAKTIRRMTPGMQIHELFCWVYWLAAGALDAAVFVWVFVIPLFPDRAVGSPLPDGPTLVAAFFGLCTAALARDTIFNVVPAKAPTKTAEKDTKEDAQGKQGKNKK